MFPEKNKTEELVTVTNRGYYTLRNFSGNKPEAIIDVRWGGGATYTTGPKRLKEISEQKLFLSNPPRVNNKASA